jgi:DNA-binding SARP family transcriptional activator
MRYELLGPLRVVDNGGTTSISARKIEMLLRLLLIRAGQVVTGAQIISEIWGDNAPRRATAVLHVYISELRKFLARPGQSESPIVTKAPGYLLRLAPGDEVDVQLFMQQLNRGRMYAREQRHEEAVACFKNALLLWREPTLGDLRSGLIIDRFVRWLEEARMECMEMLIDSQLQLGWHRELVGRLYSLIAEYPLCETFYRQLMLALYRSERTADALKIYQLARRTLNEELGLEPNRALQGLQQRILAADDELELCATASPRFARPAGSAHQLHRTGSIPHPR